MLTHLRDTADTQTVQCYPGTSPCHKVSPRSFPWLGTCSQLDTYRRTTVQQPAGTRRWHKVSLQCTWVQDISIRRCSQCKRWLLRRCICLRHIVSVWCWSSSSLRCKRCNWWHHRWSCTHLENELLAVYGM